MSLIWAVGESVLLLLWMPSAPWSSSCASDTRWLASPQLGFSVAKQARMFWHLLPGPVIGGQVFLHSVQRNGKKRMRPLSRKQEEFGQTRN